MATTLTTGMVSTSQGPAHKQVLDMADKIYLLEPNAAPLYVLVSKLNKRVAINPTFQWLNLSSGHSKLYYMLENLKSFLGRKETRMKDETISRELLETQLAWLAGIIDGEGYFLIANHSKHAQEKYGFYTKRIRLGVHNTDVRMISEISKIWKKLGVTFHYSLRKHDKPTHKPSMCIELDGKRNIIKALRPIIPHLINKKDQAELCLEYAQYRLERGKPRDELGQLVSTMTEKDEHYMTKLLDLKHNLKDPSETTRKAGEILMI